MPEITPLGWLHTILGAVAIVSAVFTLTKHKEITLQTPSGRLYLAATLITAATALGIYQRGTFGPGHVLAVMTLLALAVGTIAARSSLFGRYSRHLKAVSFTATLLFHSIPAVTDGLLRLPVGNPLLSSIDDPILKICYLVLLVLFLIGVSVQLRWIQRQPD